jgi:putative ATP-dependent endonuclease of OLD family
MYISTVHITNYRCFQDTLVDFVPGVNVIIGENNSGKTALLRALGLVFGGPNRPRMQLFDFNRAVSDLTRPPAITVTVTLRSEGQTVDRIEDKALVASWLVRLESPWEAQLTYRFALPDEDVPLFMEHLGTGPSVDTFWSTVAYFLSKYVSRIYGGRLDAQLRAEPEHLGKFSYQFVDAIRDAASQLFSGSNPLLRSMLEQVLDHDIESDNKKDRNAKERATAGRRADFQKQSTELTNALKQRISLDALTTLITGTGAEDGGVPQLSGALDEADIISALKLFIERSGLALPATFNGLGYNNLVYISLLLASLDLDTDHNRRGQNAIVFPMLVLEEPEAHLHPALQYKLLRFIRQRELSRTRQVFLTTHSTHITAAAGLDSIICLSAPIEKADPHVSYPGKVFADSDDGRSSKAYVARFLDATKSAMLFAKGIVFVEGLAEQLVIPCLAEWLRLPLETKHVAIVAVGGSTFKHFLPLFGAGCGHGLAKYALRRRVSCVVDGDPMRRAKADKRASWRKCWPFELGRDLDTYEYKVHSGVIDTLHGLCKDQTDVLVEPGPKTFEYDLASHNAHSDVLSYKWPQVAADQELRASLDAIADLKDRRRAEFAAGYLVAIEGAKGEHAFLLARHLRDELPRVSETLRVQMGKIGDADEGTGPKLAKAVADRTGAIVPDHIKRAIQWACGLNIGEATA